MDNSETLETLGPTIQNKQNKRKHNTTQKTKKISNNDPTKNTTQKTKKMSNKDPTKKHNTEN
jgi:hypothetical protein